MGQGTGPDSVSHRFSGANLYLTDVTRANTNISQCGKMRKTQFLESNRSDFKSQFPPLTCATFSKLLNL